MKTWKTIEPENIDNVFSRIGKDWMLIGTSDGHQENIMTASWGGLGVLWNKPVAIVFIRPQRHTFTLSEASERLTLSFFEGEEYRAALTYCGKNSGRDGNKFEGAALHKVTTKDGIPYPAEASLVLCCKKLYADFLKEDGFVDVSLLKNYEAGDYHRVYVCEIEQTLLGVDK